MDLPTVFSCFALFSKRFYLSKEPLPKSTTSNTNILQFVRTAILHKISHRFLRILTVKLALLFPLLQRLFHTAGSSDLMTLQYWFNNLNILYACAGDKFLSVLRQQLVFFLWWLRSKRITRTHQPSHIASHNILPTTYVQYSEKRELSFTL